LVDWNTVASQALTAAGSGASAFLGAFLRYKARLKACEDALKLLATEVPKMRTDLATALMQYDSSTAGWRLEFDGFKDDFEREMKHRKDIDEAVEKERHSRPDPLEDLRREVKELRSQIEQLKERGGRYVRNDAFTAFMRAQEEQWKEMARTLGRLEGAQR
jgi:hypothetical protein